ncbi:SPT3 Dosage dependent suppressor of Ty-induced promoter mutations-like protein [Dissophora ornata]|nr:SPT3 Dosage dependent suppressor of Ty-induced promoter mutations-like protein [Dissophora ornata]
MDSSNLGSVSGPTVSSNGVSNYQANGWVRSENAMLNGGSSLLGASAQDDLLRRLSHSSGGSDMSARSSGFAHEMAGYMLDARIIQKKDQMEEISSSGEIIQAPAVEEVRTGQQFLIKLQLSKQGSPVSSLPSKFPTMRVDRREAINTAGEPRSDIEPLTLQIVVHLVKSGQIRKGACAKCCHKYGPSSPILVLLDPLSPSATDPSSYAHVDTSAGSVTILAKVICSSTDHGERGNKDRYLFEFRLKRTSSMLNGVSSKMNMSPVGGVDARDDDGEIIASCYTAPIMCSGHHKAKRVYPSQRPSKVTKEGPVPKTKVIKRNRSLSSAVGTIQTTQLFSNGRPDEFLRSGSISSSSNYPSPLSFVQDASVSVMSNFGDDQSSDFDFGPNTFANQQLLSSNDSPLDPSQQLQSQSPKVHDVRPDHGPVRKTTDVILRGLFFREGMVPYFGCFPAHDIRVETSTLIICKAPECPIPGTVPISIYDSVGTNFADLGQFTYTDDSETELLILQLQLRLAHRALEYLHSKATGQKGNATDILRDIPGLSSSSSRSSPSGGAVMADSLEEKEATAVEDSSILSLEQVEEGILRTLDQLPAAVDISMPLDDQGNLLHFSVLLGFNKLTMRLIEEGCDLEALDAWGMTPLMYAVIKGNEAVVRTLVLAGASSSGAKTPAEFYTFLPRPVSPTRVVVGYLSVSCKRYSNTSRTLVRGNSHGRLLDMVEIEHDETSGSSEDESDAEDQTDKTLAAVKQQADQKNIPTIAMTAAAPTEAAVTEAAVGTTTQPAAAAQVNPESSTLAQVAQAIRGVRTSQVIPPLDQQHLPQMHIVESDGSVTVNTAVLKSDDIRRGVSMQDSTTTNANNGESGYHSGVISEIQDRLLFSSQSSLPSKGVEMTVEFYRPPPTSASTPASTPFPDNVFRTGESFNMEIRLTTVPVPGFEYTPMPAEFLGVRFPREMVKRARGRQASILNEMTYILKTSIELGNPAKVHDHKGDGIQLDGACQSCSDYLNKQKKVSQQSPSVCSILQLSVPGDSPTPQALQDDAGVMELHNGRLEVKAKVNCSSIHYVVQREKAKRRAELHLQQQQQSESSSSATKEKMPLDLASLEDPGYVFTFELVHPTLNTVVARYETVPTKFSTYKR